MERTPCSGLVSLAKEWRIAVCIITIVFASFIMASCSNQADDTELMSPWLTVRDGQVVNTGSGQQIRLRGSNLDMFYFAEPDWSEIVWNYVDEWMLDQFQDFGVTQVRLGFHWTTLAEIEPEIRLKMDAVQRYRDVVELCKERGIYVILSMHVPPGNLEIDPIDHAFWQNDRHRVEICEIWRLLAMEFVDEPFVMAYDLFNEPTPPHEDDWWSLADEIIAAIRSVDSRHIIVVEPPLAGDRGFRQVNDPLVLYSFHFYEPFAISHKGANWMGDTALPDDAIYPGAVITDMEYLGASDVSPTITGSTGWTQLETAEITVPDEAGFATIYVNAWGGAADFRFDDFQVLKNGEDVSLVNRAINEESWWRPDQPRAWFSIIEGDYSCSWDRNMGAQERGCLRIHGTSGWAAWHQYEWAYFRQPLIPVQPGDRLTVRAMARSLNSTAEAGVSLYFLKPVTTYYDKEYLRSLLLEGISWLRERKLAGHVGEFGAMAMLDNDDSATNLIADMASLWNEYDLPWTLWTGRDMSPATERSFGVMTCSPYSKPQDCQTFRTSILNPWRSALNE